MTAPGVPANVDPFAAVPMTGGGNAPGARHLEGRVVIVRPIRVDENALSFDKKTVAPTLIADIIVVDGGPIRYGDQIDTAGRQLKPVSHEIQTPCMFRGWLDSHTFVVNAGRDLLAAGQPVTVGIIERGTKGNRPYFLTETHTDVDRQPRTDPQYAQRRQNAINLFNALNTGQWKSPDPIELNPPAATSPATGSWGAGQQVAQTIATGGWGAQPAPAAVQQQPNPLQALAASWGAPAAAPAAPPMRDLSQPVPGLEAVWSGATEQQRQAAWALFDQQNAPAAQPVAPAQSVGW